ncbi:MAG: hypothetical protein ACLTOX_03065 [Streptococcus thermophilus]
MSTISMRAADDAYVANHPRLIEDLKNYLQSNGANAGNRDQLTRQYCMETYLPNSIKKVSPSVAKTDETNIFKDCSVELLRKTISGPFPIKMARSKNEITIYSPTYTGQQETITKNVKHKKISRMADFLTSHASQRFARYSRTS